MYIESAEKLFDRAVKDGWNADGEPGIVYTTDWNGKPVVHDRMHWVLAEAINTSAVLWHVTGKQKYADAYAGFMEYLDEKVLDHKMVPGFIRWIVTMYRAILYGRANRIFIMQCRQH